MTCKYCDMTHTAANEDQIRFRCMRCGSEPKIKNAPYEVGKYHRSIEALIEALKNSDDYTKELKTATAMFDKVESPFTLSVIRCSADDPGQEDSRESFPLILLD